MSFSFSPHLFIQLLKKMEGLMTKKETVNYREGGGEGGGGSSCRN